MLQFIHGTTAATIQVHIAEYDSETAITAEMVNLQTKESTTQNGTNVKVNDRAVSFNLDLRNLEIGMYRVDIKQGTTDKARHLMYLRYDGKNAFEPKPYNTYTTNPSPDVVYNG
jgi:hypothetical protein